MSHTPGPWKFAPNSYNASDGDVVKKIKSHSPGSIVSSISPRYYVAMIENAPESKGNAALIAAAPDLLAFVRKQYEATFCICHLNAIGGTDVPCTRCEADALIAKAEGK